MVPNIPDKILGFILIRVNVPNTIPNPPVSIRIIPRTGGATTGIPIPVIPFERPANANTTDAMTKPIKSKEPPAQSIS